MDTVALTPNECLKAIRRIVATRHPHLAPVHESEIEHVIKRAVSPARPSMHDQHVVHSLWSKGCRLLLLLEPTLELADWVIDQQADGDPRRMIIFVCRDRHELLSAMILAHRKGRLDRAGLYWADGTCLERHLREIFTNHCLFLFRPDTIAWHICYSSRARETGASYRDAIARFTSWLTAQREAHNGRFQRLRETRGKPVLVWSYAFAGSGNYIHGPMLCALSRGMREAGVQAEISLVESDDPALPQRLLDDFARRCPTVFLCLNSPAEQAYRLFLDDRVCRSLPQTRLVWLVDHPRFNLRVPFGQKDVVWAPDGSYAEVARSTGTPRDVVVAPPAADLDRPGIVRDELRCPLAFVGIFHDTTSFVRAMSRRTRDTIEDLVARMIAGEDVFSRRGFLRDIPPEDVERSRPVFEEFCKRLGRLSLSDEDKILFVASVTASSRKRAEAVKALLPFGIRVYGNDAWRSVLGDRARDLFRGPADRADLPDIYASADINLNCHSPQLPRGLNARDFNVLRAGGCLLSDYVPDMESGVLRPGRDLAVFHGIESLLASVEHLLQNPGERHQMAQSGLHTVVSNHLYCHRALWLREYLER